VGGGSVGGVGGGGVGGGGVGGGGDVGGGGVGGGGGGGGGSSDHLQNIATLKKKQRIFLYRTTLPASVIGITSLLRFWKC